MNKTEIDVDRQTNRARSFGVAGNEQFLYAFNLFSPALCYDRRLASVIAVPSRLAFFLSAASLKRQPW